MDLFNELRVREAAAPFERLARKALAAYGLEEARLDPVSVQRRMVFRAVDPSEDLRYALQIHPRDDDRRGAQRPLLWMTALCRETDVPCPEPILTRGGDLAQSVSTPGVTGFRTVTMVSWIEGRALPSSEWTPRDARAVGALLAHLHAHGDTFRFPPELDRPPRTAETVRSQLPNVLRALDSRQRALIESSFERISSGLQSSGPVSLLHGNLRPEHILFRDGAPSLIAFHGMHRGDSAYDLATLERSLRLTGGGEGARSALVEGYVESSDRAVCRTRIDRLALLRAWDELCNEAAAGHARTAGRLVDEIQGALPSP